MLLIGSVAVILGIVTLLALAILMVQHMRHVTVQLQQLIDITERVGHTAERAALRAETVLQYASAPMPPEPTRITTHTVTSDTHTTIPPEEPPHAPPTGG